MNCNTHSPRTRGQRTARHYQPHFGNLINEFFNTAVGDVVTNNERKNFTNPAVNVVEYDDKFELQLALPGFSKEDVSIKFEDERLIVASIIDSKESKTNFRLREFNYEGFKKQFRLPETVDTNSISANFEFGILTIQLAKKDEAIPQPARKIIID